MPVLTFSPVSLTAFTHQVTVVPAIRSTRVWAVVPDRVIDIHCGLLARGTDQYRSAEAQAAVALRDGAPAHHPAGGAEPGRARGVIAANPARHLEVSYRRPHAKVWTDGRVQEWQATGERPSVAVWTADQLAVFLRTVVDDGLFALW